jgi:lipoyl(octanoyl) transferase
MVISVINLGRCDYGTALRLQETLVALRKEERVGNVLLFVEHPAVITLGRNAKEANIIASREFLAGKGVEVFEINRGGDVTLHAPGQLVAYPIFDLRSLEGKVGAVEFVRRLEEVLMRTCAQWAIGWDYTPVGEESNSKEKAGKWSERKVAAIGVHISRGVTSHGFALNVTTDLGLYQYIVPCGLTKPVTSIEFETGERPSLEDVMVVAARCFGEIFASQILWLESLDDLLPKVAWEQDTPARAPENERRVAGDDVHNG